MWGTIHETQLVSIPRSEGTHSNSLTVFVRGNQGEVYSISNLSMSSTANELYSEMTARTGIPSSFMRLLIAQKALKPYNTLRSCGIVNGCSINLSGMWRRER